MNAFQFIQKFGFKSATEVLKGAPDNAEYYCHEFQIGKIRMFRSYSSNNDSIHTINLKDLKRLVDSVELINLFGSIATAKSKVKMADFNGFLLVSVPIEDGLADVYIHKVEQAIRDHESIYGGGDE